MRLLLAITLLVVAATAALTMHFTRRGGLTGDIVAARAAWMKHLEAGDFAKARPVLEQAAVEIKRYGAASRDWRETDQLAREVALFAELPDRSWEELLQEVIAMSPEECTEHFRDELNYPAIVFDVYVSPLGNGSNNFRSDTRLFVGSNAVRLDLSDFSLLKLVSPGLSTRVLFGARIEWVERPSGSDDWIIHLVPDSGTLITSELCLEKVGWPMDESTRELLELQSKWVLEQP